MNTININKHQFSIFIEEDKIQTRIKELTKEIEHEYVDKEVCFIAVLNGALFFASDLILNYTKPCTLQTIKCKSYEGMESSGEIKFELPFTNEITGRHVVFLEDIIDTGNTLHFLLQEIQKFKPTSVKICSLLLKPEALKNEIPIDYIGFEIPNKFVLGYGLDYDGLGRNYRDIYVLV